MIVKTLRWKVGGFGRLVDYVGRELIDYVDKEQNRDLLILHNLRQTDDLGEIAQQFAENDAYRKRRKNGVALYHEILSFHARDRDAITPEVLEDITREYLRLRAPRALAFAAPHYDRDHVHVHIAISGTEFRSSKTLRMDNRTFTRVRRQIEHHQLTHYPELEHSVVHLPKRVRSKALQEEIENERPVIERCYEEAHGLKDFLDRVAAAGIDASKYPLDQTRGTFSFDVDLARLADLDRRMQELRALRRLEVVCEHLGFPGDGVPSNMIKQYEDYLGVPPSTSDSCLEQRLEELDDVKEDSVHKDYDGDKER